MLSLLHLFAQQTGPITAPALELAYGPLPAIFFYCFAALTVASAFWVVGSRNIIRAAVGLLMALMGVSGLYFLLQAEFIAAVQLVVYVGGTLILLIFGVMLTSRSPGNVYLPKRYEVIWASVVGVLLGVPLVVLMLATPWQVGAPMGAEPHSIEEIGRALLTSNAYLAPFELISVLLLAVMIGSAYLAKGRQSVTGSRGESTGSGGSINTATLYGTPIQGSGTGEHA